jgi:hypothetical protein
MKKGDDAFNSRDVAGMNATNHPDIIAHVMGTAGRFSNKNCAPLSNLSSIEPTKPSIRLIVAITVFTCAPQTSANISSLLKNFP